MQILETLMPIIMAVVILKMLQTIFGSSEYAKTVDKEKLSEDVLKLLNAENSPRPNTRKSRKKGRGRNSNFRQN